MHGVQAAAAAWACQEKRVTGGTGFGDAANTVKRSEASSRAQRTLCVEFGEEVLDVDGTSGVTAAALSIALEGHICHPQLASLEDGDHVRPLHSTFHRCCDRMDTKGWLVLGCSKLARGTHIVNIADVVSGWRTQCAHQAHPTHCLSAL